MSDPLWFSAGKALLSPFFRLVGWGHEKLQRPHIALRRAPKNLFEHVKPGISVPRMREVLGVPHREEQGQYRYVFSEACVQLDSEDETTVDAISVGLSTISWRHRFRVWPMHFVLGKTTFRSVVEPEDKVEFDFSSKHYHFYVVKHFGFSGLYWSFALGVLECPWVYPDHHHWSPTQQSREQIPPEMKINWASVTRSGVHPTFNYLGFL